ncbi:MAG: bifunctional riboflavin kinase/FAD synthetase [Candidatus Pelethousia sp.]|nr:bifunctional riboflavin kinase/FAD synthetase [Candidatus Pelethousia sp.]
MDSVIALGTFDGVHLGHRQLIDAALALAKENGLRPLIYTFSNHPGEAYGQKARLLMPGPARIAALSALCETVADPFDAAFAAVEHADFIRMLIDRFSMKTAVAGFNYTFGKGGAGDIALLRELGAQMGFSVCEIPPCAYAGAPISSSRIRSAVEEGDMEAAAAMLGRPFTLAGQVSAGKAIGHSLGFPTANLLAAEDQVLPATGVYASWATLEDGCSRPAVTNVGCNPTVGGREITVETHILDVRENLYGRALEVAFARRLREDRRFPSREALAAQIGRDVNEARAVLAGGDWKMP